MKMLVLGKKIFRLFGLINLCIQMISISACTESSETSPQTTINDNLQDKQDLAVGDSSEKDNASTPSDESDSFCIDALLPTEDHRPMIKIGTGRTSYQNIDQMQTLTVVKGPQGGYHIWGSFMAKCIPFKNVRILFELKDEDRLLAIADYTEMELSLDDQNTFEYLAVTVIYLHNEWVMENTDKALTFSVKVSPIDKPDLVFSDQIEIKTACCQ
jgi:hypothetical protein